MQHINLGYLSYRLVSTCDLSLTKGKDHIYYVLWPCISYNKITAEMKNIVK